MLTDKIISNAPYAANVGTIIAGLTVKEWGIIIGIIITTITAIVNWVYKHRQDRRETEIFKKQMNELADLTNK